MAYNLTRALAVEWAPHGIRVNAISLTFVRTERNASMLEAAELSEAIQRDVLLGRPATPEEIAAGIA